jgi:hypothetical protein
LIFEAQEIAGAVWRNFFRKGKKKKKNHNEREIAALCPHSVTCRAKGAQNVGRNARNRYGKKEKRKKGSEQQ